MKRKDALDSVSDEKSIDDLDAPVRRGFLAKATAAVAGVVGIAGASGTAAADHGPCNWHCWCDDCGKVVCMDGGSCETFQAEPCGTC